MDRRTHRILVVDDNRDSADSLVMAFGVLGHAATAAYSGRDALRTLEQVEPSLVVLDLSMPEMDGYALARSIRAHARFGRVTMVALSGFGSEADRTKSRESGFDAHMLKPFDLTDLEAMLELASAPATPAH
jgi:CheY-like chemotaxis protein